jgi:hypothetical protein
VPQTAERDFATNAGAQRLSDRSAYATCAAPVVAHHPHLQQRPRVTFPRPLFFKNKNKIKNGLPKPESGQHHGLENSGVMKMTLSALLCKMMSNVIAYNEKSMQTRQ